MKNAKHTFDLLFLHSFRRLLVSSCAYSLPGPPRLDRGGVRGRPGEAAEGVEVEAAELRRPPRLGRGPSFRSLRIGHGRREGADGRRLCLL